MYVCLQITTRVCACNYFTIWWSWSYHETKLCAKKLIILWHPVYGVPANEDGGHFLFLLSSLLQIASAMFFLCFLLSEGQNENYYVITLEKHWTAESHLSTVLYSCDVWRSHQISLSELCKYELLLEKNTRFLESLTIVNVILARTKK
jgi:hypothetical protein